ncbi:MAG: dihydropteroate synthase [Desulfuromonadaceae bacterium]|nr:dihydropteroate synthase [Desulfuromonas sp.]MDY0184793.1 dihydropteroate synthase [Desulfuromonadaceae bacterium]
MEMIGVDPGGIQRMAGKAAHLNILLQGISCGAANILKQEMLSLGGDAAVARGTVCCSITHSDVMLMGTSRQLHALARRLPAQPFGLKKVGQRLAALLGHHEHPPRQLKGRGVTLDLNRPCVMGILNATPDSFHDGGTCADLDALLRRAAEQVRGGADLFDVGGESTRPGAPQIEQDAELERILPLIAALRREFDLPVSVDTNKAEVARLCLEGGAAFVNDISGLGFDPHMAQVVAQAQAGVFLMHTPARPDVMQNHTSYTDLMTEIIASLEASAVRAQEAGIDSGSIAFDPGIGFGKNVSGNLTLIQRLKEIVDLGYPVLLGTSRKGFIGHVLKQPQTSQRLAGSLATIVLGLAHGARIFRVHDVEPSRQALDMAWAVCTNG